MVTTAVGASARTFTPAQIAAEVIAAGFADPVRATAVVLGESGGNASKVSPANTDGTVDVGLWQINSGHFPGGKYDRGEIDRAAALDPVRATAWALKYSKGGTDFGLWSATRSPNFAGHMVTAQTAVAGAGGGTPGAASPSGWKIPGLPSFDLPGPSDIPIVGPIVGGATDAAKIAAKIGSVLLDPQFWFRAALVSGGVAVMVLGVIIWKKKITYPLIGAAAGGPAGAQAGAALAAGSDAKDAGEIAGEVASDS